MAVNGPRECLGPMPIWLWVSGQRSRHVIQKNKKPRGLSTAIGQGRDPEVNAGNIQPDRRHVNHLMGFPAIPQSGKSSRALRFDSAGRVGPWIQKFRPLAKIMPVNDTSINFICAFGRHCLPDLFTDLKYPFPIL